MTDDQRNTTFPHYLLVGKVDYVHQDGLYDPILSRDGKVACMKMMRSLTELAERPKKVLLLSDNYVSKQHRELVSEAADVVGQFLNAHNMQFAHVESKRSVLHDFADMYERGHQASIILTDSQRVPECLFGNYLGTAQAPFQVHRAIVAPTWEEIKAAGNMRTQ